MPSASSCRTIARATVSISATRRGSGAFDKPFELDAELSFVLLLAKVHTLKVSVQLVPRSTPDELDALLTLDESFNLKMAVGLFGNRSIIAHHGS